MKAELSLNMSTVSDVYMDDENDVIYSDVLLPIPSETESTPQPAALTSCVTSFSDIESDEDFINQLASAEYTLDQPTSLANDDLTCDDDESELTYFNCGQLQIEGQTSNTFRNKYIMKSRSNSANAYTGLDDVSVFPEAFDRSQPGRSTSKPQFDPQFCKQLDLSKMGKCQVSVLAESSAGSRTSEHANPSAMSKILRDTTESTHLVMESPICQTTTKHLSASQSFEMQTVNNTNYMKLKKTNTSMDNWCLQLNPISESPRFPTRRITNDNYEQSTSDSEDFHVFSCLSKSSEVSISNSTTPIVTSVETKRHTSTVYVPSKHTSKRATAALTAKRSTTAKPDTTMVTLSRLAKRAAISNSVVTLAATAAGNAMSDAITKQTTLSSTSKSAVTVAATAKRFTKGAKTILTVNPSVIVDTTDTTVHSADTIAAVTSKPVKPSTTVDANVKPLTTAVLPFMRRSSALICNVPATNIKETHMPIQLHTLPQVIVATQVNQSSYAVRREHKHLVETGKDICNELSCRMGCVCDSIAVHEQHQQHCRNIECMFSCSCSRESILAMEHQSSRIEQNVSLAEKEHEFLATVVLSEDRNIHISNCGNVSKLSKHVPKRYQTEDDDKNSMPPLKSSAAKRLTNGGIGGRINTPNSSSAQVQVGVTAVVQATSEFKDAEQEQRIQRALNHLRHCEVSLTRLPKATASLDQWCMVHQLYKCVCMRRSIDDADPVNGGKRRAATDSPSNSVQPSASKRIKTFERVASKTLITPSIPPTPPSPPAILTPPPPSTPTSPTSPSRPEEPQMYSQMTHCTNCISHAMNEILHRQLNNKHICHMTRSDILQWDYFRQLFQNKYICVWNVGTKTNNIWLCLTLANEMPEVLDALYVLDVRTMPFTLLPLLAQMLLRDNLETPYSKQLALLVCPIANYWRVASIFVSRDNYISDDSIKLSAPQASNPIKLSMFNMKLQMFKRSLQNETEVASRLLSPFKRDKVIAANNPECEAKSQVNDVPYANSETLQYQIEMIRDHQPANNMQRVVESTKLVESGLRPVAFLDNNCSETLPKETSAPIAKTMNVDEPNLSQTCAFAASKLPKETLVRPITNSASNEQIKKTTAQTINSSDAELWSASSTTIVKKSQRRLQQNNQPLVSIATNDQVSVIVTIDELDIVRATAASKQRMLTKVKSMVSLTPLITEPAISISGAQRIACTPPVLLCPPPSFVYKSRPRTHRSLQPLLSTRQQQVSKAPIKLKRNSVLLQPSHSPNDLAPVLVNPATRLVRACDLNADTYAPVCDNAPNQMSSMLSVASTWDSACATAVNVLPASIADTPQPILNPPSIPMESMVQLTDHPLVHSISFSTPNGITIIKNSTELTISSVKRHQSDAR